MRISDWSSGVCSSEIELGGRNAADREFGLAIVAEHRDAQNGGLARDLGAAVDPGRLELGAAQRRHRDRHVLETQLALLRRDDDRAVVCRSEERRVGTDCVSTCSSLWSTYRT